ncbi:MAG TPA: hypothetical protein DCL01_13200 [Thauera sp.]|nr:hypothetical protein [Thauera sp.]HHW65378.1 ATP-binding protein [Rhodocyclaceae bacterium]
MLNLTVRPTDRTASRRHWSSTTDLSFGERPSVIGDATATMALLDRLTHHRHIV